MDENGDISIVNGRIEMIEGSELLAQTVQSVLGTNKGEWVLNKEEGINFRNILGKSPKTTKSKVDTQRHLEQEIDYMQTKENELAERLRKRLDGTL